jgi:hypothetical protein
MTGTVLYSPLLPWPVIAALVVLAVAGIGLAVWRGLSGWMLRGLAALVLIAALTGPVLQREMREGLADIVLLVTDNTASQRLSDRNIRTPAAADALADRLAARGAVETRRVQGDDAEGDGGSQLMSAISEALAKEPNGRVA